MSELYAVLDVAPDAAPATIKAAHRRAVKRTHPDKPGGTRAAFEAVTRAWLVLSDPEKRARYDRDGTVDDKPDNRASAVLELALEAFNKALGGAFDKLGELDVIRAATEILDESEQRLLETIRAGEKRLRQFDEARRRLSYSGDRADFVARSLDAQFVETADRLKRLQQQVAICGEARALFVGYRYAVDRAADGGGRVRPQPDFDAILSGEMFRRYEPGRRGRSPWIDL